MMDKKEINQQFKKICARYALGASSSFCRSVEELLSKEERTLKWKIVLVAVERIGSLKQSVPHFTETTFVSTRDGFIQLEWESKERCLEFQATDPGWYIVGTTIKPDNRRAYCETECDPFDDATLLTCYRWFAGEKVVWPETHWLTKWNEVGKEKSDEESSAWIR